MTVREHFEAIEDPVIREQALANMNDVWGLRVVDNLKQAISTGFVWAETPQRWDYWIQYFDSL